MLLNEQFFAVYNELYIKVYVYVLLNVREKKILYIFFFVCFCTEF